MNKKKWWIVLLFMVMIIYIVFLGLKIKDNKDNGKVNAMNYLEDKYGLKVEFVEEKEINKLATTDNFFKANNYGDKIVCVQTDIFGDIITDDFNLVILEKKISEKYSKLTTELWGNNAEVAACFVSLDSVAVLRNNGKYSGYRNGIFLSADLSELLEEQRENISIDNLINELPDYSLEINIETVLSNIDNLDEKDRILRFLENIKNHHYKVYGIQLNYKTSEGKNIGSLYIDDLNEITGAEDIQLN